MSLILTKYHTKSSTLEKGAVGEDIGPLVPADVPIKYWSQVMIPKPF